MQVEASTLKLAISSSHSKAIQARVVSWASLCKKLNRVNIGTKEGAGWVAAKIPDGPRNNERVISSSLLVYDIDNKESIITQAELEKTIRDNGYRAILHSTYNHTKHQPRFRLILDISEPIEPTDHKSLLLHVAQYLGLGNFIDTACTDLCRYFYLPRCTAEHIADYVFWSNDGDPVDIKACLEKIKFDRKPSEPRPLLKIDNGVSTWEENDIKIAKIKEFLRFCPADCDYDKWRNIIWSVSSLSWDIGPSLLLGWSKTSRRHWTEDAAPKTETALENLINEFDSDRGITVGTLIDEAKKNGWTPASPFEPELIFEPPATMDLDTPSRGYKIYSRDDLGRLPKQQWLIHGVLPLQGTAAIFGAPGTGKSFLALDLAARISEGIDQWFGIGTKQRDVVYMALEGGGGIRKRIDAWEIENSMKVKNLKLVIGEFNLKSTEDVSGFLTDMSPMVGKGWVTFIDTLNQASPGSDENSSVDMGLLLAAAKRIANYSGGLVVLIHHSGKNADKGLRGHSSMNGAMDLTIEVRKNTTGNSWNTHKVKDGYDGITKHFALAVHTTSGSTFEEHETSCAIRPDESPRQMRTPQGSRQKLVYEGLKVKYEVDGPISEIDALNIAGKSLVAVPEHRLKTTVKGVLASLKTGQYIKEDENNCIYLP